MRLVPDKFIKDPLGWGGNQSGHIMCGLTSYFYMALGWNIIGGNNSAFIIWGILAIGYVIFESVTQGWYGWDTIEDWSFVTIYGGGAATLLYLIIPSEYLNIIIIGMFIFTIHMTIGILKRR